MTKGKDGFYLCKSGQDACCQGSRSGRWSVGPEKLGERAGSGLCSICNVWERVFHTAAVIEETEDVDRVILTLSYGGHEQDVDAMLRLYEAKGELMVVGDPGRYVNENETFE